MHELVENYALARSLRDGSLEQLEFALGSFGRFLGRPATDSDFFDVQVNRYLLWLASKGYAHETIRARRRMILTLWRFLHDEGRAPAPRKIRQLSPCYSIPVALTREQVQAVLAQCGRLVGTFRCHPTIERRTFMLALCRTLYETGFRRSDALRIRRPQIQKSGLIVLVQSKTGRPHVARMRPETIALIDQLDLTGRDTVFGGVMCPRNLGKACSEIFKAAGVPEASMKWLRRSGATHVEMERPGEGWLYLGHTTPRLAPISYLDPHQLGQEPRMPPEPPAT